MKRARREESAILSWREDLESDQTVQPRVTSLVDHAHAALAQSFEDLVTGEGLAEQGVGHWGGVILAQRPGLWTDPRAPGYTGDEAPASIAGR